MQSSLVSHCMFPAAGLIFHLNLRAPTLLPVSFQLLLKNRNAPTGNAALHRRGDKWSVPVAHSHDTGVTRWMQP